MSYNGYGNGTYNNGAYNGAYQNYGSYQNNAAQHPGIGNQPTSFPQYAQYNATGHQPPTQSYANAQGANPYGPNAYAANPYGNGFPTMVAPRPPVSFGTALGRFFANYAQFKGRANRGEFWYPVGLILLIEVILYIVAMVNLESYNDANVAIGAVAMILLLLIALGTAVPMYAVTARRLHDTGKSGWLCLLYLAGSIGSIVLAVLCSLEFSPQSAKYEVPNQR